MRNIRVYLDGELLVYAISFGTGEVAIVVFTGDQCVTLAGDDDHYTAIVLGG